MVFQIFPSTPDFFSYVLLVFWTALFESAYGRLFLEQYFRDLAQETWW